MGRVCTVCQHEDLNKIDVWIVSGVSSLEIARRTGLSGSAVRRHRMSGLHLRSWKVQELKDEEATIRRRVNAVVRVRSNRALQKLQQEPEPAAWTPPPPLGLVEGEQREPERAPPPPAKPEPVNPPNKLFTEAEAMRIQSRARAKLSRPLRPPGVY